MARQRKVDVDARDAQPPLVDLTDEEKAALPSNLATAVKELEDLEAEHKKIRRAQGKERKQVNAKISAYASQIRNGGR